MNKVAKAFSITIPILIIVTIILTVLYLKKEPSPGGTPPSPPQPKPSPPTPPQPKPSPPTPPQPKPSPPTPPSPPPPQPKPTGPPPQPKPTPPPPGPQPKPTGPPPQPKPSPPTPPQPKPTGPPPTPPPPSPPPPKYDDTDCLALQYYGTSGSAPHKVCGVFDGFSHWSWEGMKNWLRYFKSKTGVSNVIIYEAQFLPKSWFDEVGVKIKGTVPGKKTPAYELPEFCPNVKDSDCSGANFKCDQNGFFCYDYCLRVEPPNCTSDDDCVSFYKKYDCPGTAYCRTDKGVCQYHANGDNGCPKILVQKILIVQVIIVIYLMWVINRML